MNAHLWIMMSHLLRCWLSWWDFRARVHNIYAHTFRQRSIHHFEAHSLEAALTPPAFQFTPTDPLILILATSMRHMLLGTVEVEVSTFLNESLICSKKHWYGALVFSLAFKKGCTVQYVLHQWRRQKIVCQLFLLIWSSRPPWSTSGLTTQLSSSRRLMKHHNVTFQARGHVYANLFQPLTDDVCGRCSLIICFT